MIGRRHQAAMPEKDLNSVTARDHRISSYKLGTRLWLTPKENSAELIARVRRIAGRTIRVDQQPIGPLPGRSPFQKNRGKSTSRRSHRSEERRVGKRVAVS